MTKAGPSLDDPQTRAALGELVAAANGMPAASIERRVLGLLSRAGLVRRRPENREHVIATEKGVARWRWWQEREAEPRKPHANRPRGSAGDAKTMREFRSRHGLSMSETAAVLGLTQAAVWWYENEVRRLHPRTLILMALIDRDPDLLPIIRGIAAKLRRKAQPGKTEDRD